MFVLFDWLRKALTLDLVSWTHDRFGWQGPRMPAKLGDTHYSWQGTSLLKAQNLDPHLQELIGLVHLWKDFEVKKTRGPWRATKILLTSPFVSHRIQDLAMRWPSKSSFSPVMAAANFACSQCYGKFLSV